MVKNLLVSTIETNKERKLMEDCYRGAVNICSTLLRANIVIYMYGNREVVEMLKEYTQLEILSEYGVEDPDTIKI